MYNNYISNILTDRGLGIISLKENEREFIRFLKNNEILYYALSYRDKNSSWLSMIHSYHEELSSIVLKTIFELSDIFGKKRLKFFIMKTFRNYPYVDNDIDTVIVDTVRYRDYVMALKDAGYVLKPNRSILREPDKRFYVKASRDNSNGLKIHLHSIVSWNGVEFHDAAKVWQRQKNVKLRGQDIKMPSVDDELLILAAHSLFENCYVTIGELFHITKLLRNNSVNLDYLLEISKRYNWEYGLKWFLYYIDKCYKYFTTESLISNDIKNKLENTHLDYRIICNNSLPIFMPMRELFKIYNNKLFKDLYSLNILSLPRELLSFFMFSWLLRFRKTIKFLQDKIL